MSLALCVLLLAPLGQVESAVDDAVDAKASLELMVADLSKHQASMAVKPPQKLTLKTEPALRWSYPVRNVDDAALFVWMGEGRPEAVATVMSYHDVNGSRKRAYEFLSISQEPIEALHNGERVWLTDDPGIRWESLPNAATPARTLIARRRQMSELAAKFQAAVWADKNRYELRLLPQPLMRYSSTKCDVLDGCLFALVEGTDPEVILSIESSASEPGWKFAAGPMTRARVEVTFNGEVVREFIEMTGEGQLSDVYRIPEGGPLKLLDKTGSKTPTRP